MEIDNIAENILRSIGQCFPRQDLLTVFPEFVGNETFLGGILRERQGDFRLDYVNRSCESGQTAILNLLVLPADKSYYGMLVIEDVIEQALAFQAMNQQKYELFLYKRNADFRKKFLSESLLGNSKAISNVRQIIHQLTKAPTTTVLLMGETGSGKNIAARVIHHSSMPSDAPFVEINCAALPEHLIEAELFGYEKGAFTHAIAERRGLFEEAAGGTIFLDEIGDLPLNMQAKLLSVLETKKFRRLGSNKPIEVKARIISATNHDLQKEVNRKMFREDLFYRLNVISITLPPLRELKEDILTIATHLLKVFNIEFKKQVKGFSKNAGQALLNYSWPGNVRELGNCLERAMIFIEKDWIETSDLVIFEPLSARPQQTLQQWTLPNEGIVLEDIERHLIVSARQQADNNKSKAARLLALPVIPCATAWRNITSAKPNYDLRSVKGIQQNETCRNRRGHRIRRRGACQDTIRPSQNRVDRFDIAPVCRGEI